MHFYSNLCFCPHELFSDQSYDSWWSTQPTAAYVTAPSLCDSMFTSTSVFEMFCNRRIKLQVFQGIASLWLRGDIQHISALQSTARKNCRVETSAPFSRKWDRGRTIRASGNWQVVFGLQLLFCANLNQGTVLLYRPTETGTKATWLTGSAEQIIFYEFITFVFHITSCKKNKIKNCMVETVHVTHFFSRSQWSFDRNVFALHGLFCLHTVTLKEMCFKQELQGTSDKNVFYQKPD